MINKKYKLLVVLCIVLLASLALVTACNADVTISFETNGGSAIEPIVAKAGEDISALLPANPTRAGHTFAGWYSDSECTQKVQLPTTMPAKSTTFYAGWTAVAGAKLTLEPGVGGTLATTTYEVVAGTNLAEFLAYKAPVAESGLEFAGWFEKGLPLATDRTMPAGGLTLTAKYWASYTVNVYRQDTEGNYPTTAEQEKGKAYFGETFTYTPADTHFKVDSAKSTAQTESLGKNAEFTVYLIRDKVMVSFFANEPQGTTPAATIPAIECYYGAQVVLPSGAVYAITTGYRFAGWSLSSEGGEIYLANSTITANGSLSVFAIWEVGLVDLLGGADYMFVSLTEVNTLYMCREGIEYKSSSYNPSTGLFTFHSGGQEVLSGKVTEIGFYYYYQTEQATYTSTTDNSSLQLQAHGQAVYTPASGSSVSGSYEVDLESGDYMFNGGGVSFAFRLNVKATSSTFTKRSDEFGIYAQDYGIDGYYGYTLLYLDGYGEGFELLDPSDPYVDDYGYAYYAFPIKYYVNDNYITIISLVDESSYKVQLNTSISTVLDGYNIAGLYITEDEYLHNVDYEDISGSGDKLSLDGFGNATYTHNGVATKGTYQVDYSDYWCTTDGIYLQYVFAKYVSFVSVSGEVINFRLEERQDDADDGSYHFEVVNEPFGIYDFTNWFVVEGGQYTGFLYFYGDSENGAELWILVDILEDGYGYLPVYISFDTGWWESDGNAYVYHGEYDIRFKFTSGNFIVALDTDLVIIENTLIIDENGTAWYTSGGQTKEVEYSIEESLFVMYCFVIEGNERLFILDNEGAFVEIAAKDILDVKYLDANRAYDYTARIIMLAEDNALIGIRLATGKYSYALVGKVSQVAEGEYTFVLSDYLLDPAMATFVVADYSEFRFKLGDGVFYIYDNEYNLQSADGATLTTDGYGTATYTTADGIVMQGTYATVGNLILFTSESKVFTALKLDNSDTFVVVTLNESMGYYYVVDEEGYLYSDYFFLDGTGVAIYFQYDAENGIYTQFVGSYLPYEGELPSGFEDCVQYSITLGDYNYRIAAAPFGNTSSSVIGRYQYYLFDEAFYYDADIIGGGHIYANGYEIVGRIVFGKGLLPYWDQDVELWGMLYRIDLPDSYYFEDLNLLPAPNADGKYLLFIPNVDQPVQFLFDITADGAKLRTQSYGTYVLCSDGAKQNVTLLMDGHGNAYIRDAELNVIEQGTYEQVAELGANVYRFEGANSSFVYRISLENIDGDYLYVYCVYMENDGVYTSTVANSWELLVLDGFGYARYIDEYGRVTEGTYVMLDGGKIAFNSGEATWQIQLGEGTFTLVG